MRLCRPRLPPPTPSPATLTSRESRRGAAGQPPLAQLAHLAAAPQRNANYGLKQALTAGGAGAAAAGRAPPASLSHNLAAASESAASPEASLVPVDFFFDILSPYSYFAFEALCRYRHVWGLRLRLRPVFQSALISATGNQPPALNPAKAPYLTQDIRRLAVYFDVPMGQFPPSRMPAVLMGTLPVQRMLVALQAAHGDAALEAVTRALWLRYLVTDTDILSAESRLGVLQEAAGLSLEQAQVVLTASTQDAAKKALQANTTEALAHGAFGVPTIVFPVPAASETGTKDGKAMLFGSDRFNVMAQLLNKTFVGPHPTAAAAAAPEKKRRIISRL